MAKAFVCDVCGKFTKLINSISGFDIKIGERHDEFIGTYPRMHEIHDVCNNCYNQIKDKIVEMYQENQKEET